MTLTILESAVHQGTLAAGAAGLLYSLTVSAVALTAALSREPARRRAAREVLVVLLRRPERPTQPVRIGRAGRGTPDP